MKVWQSLLVAAALLIATDLPASAGARYMDTAPMIAIVKHRVHTEHVVAHRERMHRLRRERQRRQERRAAAAVATPEPTTTPTYVPSAGALTSEQVASYARGAGFPEYVIPTMVAIAYRESNFYPSAINSSSGACGLWQIYPCPGPDALDPARNAALAYSKYASSGLSPWSM